jgi:hypothetical protein
MLKTLGPRLIAGNQDIPRKYFFLFKSDIPDIKKAKIEPLHNVADF